MTTAKYIGPEITTDYAMAELCDSPEWHCELCIDWENRTIDLDSVHSSSNSWTVREHHGHENTYRVEMMVADEFAAMIKALIPLVNTVADAYDSEWDGSNHVATFDGIDKDGLTHEIEIKIESARYMAVGGIWDAGQYCEADPPEVAADASSEWIETKAVEIQSDAHDNGIHLHDIEEYLSELRAEAAEEATA